MEDDLCDSSFGSMVTLDYVTPDTALPDGGGEACRLYCSVPGPLQSVQRAELWGVLVALQGCLRLHVGVDNLNVVNHLSGLVAGRRAGRPFPLVNDGDLLALTQWLLRWRGDRTDAVSKFKGHADEGMVAQGRVRELDRIGNNEANAAADLGRKRVHHVISDARRTLNKACARWYPVVCDLHRFFIAIARAALNEDGLAGTSLHPVVWATAANPKRRRVEPVVRNFAWLPGPPGLWTARWFRVPGTCIDEADVAAWPFSVSLLVKIACFLGTLHWPCGVDDLGIGGVSYLELLILYELWAGERLVPEVAIPARGRRKRPILVSAVPAFQALILGVHVCSSVACFGPCVSCLEACLGFCLAVLGRITVACVMLFGRSVDMVLHLGLGRPQSLSFWTLSWGCLGILLVLVTCCLLVIFRCGIILVVLLYVSLLGNCLGKEVSRHLLLLLLSFLALEMVV